MLPTLQGVRLSEQNGAIRVSGRNLVPIEVEPEELPALEAVHLGHTQDRLALAVKDLGDHGFTVLNMKTAMDGAPVDRMALYRFATGTHRSGRMAVRPPRQRQPIDIRSAETINGLCFFLASGEDFGLSNRPLADGLKSLGASNFRFHADGAESETIPPYKSYQRVAEWGDKLLWVSREGGPRVPFSPRLAEQPEELTARYELARQLDPLLPASLGARERAEFWEAGYTGKDPETRLRCLARMASVAPLKEACAHYESISAKFEPQHQMRITDSFVELAQAHGTSLAAESFALLAVPVENEELEDRAELFREVLDGPAGTPGATPLDRRVEYVRGAIQRFAEEDPAGARVRLSNAFLLERGTTSPEQAQAIGHTEGRLVIGGVLVRGKRPGE